MGLGNSRHLDPDDYFAESRMSFGDHLEDLRLHLWRAIVGFLVALVFGFIVGKPVLRFISVPVENELQRYWDNYYEKKHTEIVRMIRAGTLSGGMPFQTTIRIDTQALKEGILGNQPKGVKPPLDILPTLRPLLRQLGLDDWSAPNQGAESRWLEVPVELVNVTEFASEMKRYETLVGRRPALATLNVQEGFMVYVKVSIVAGLVLASPWIFYQIWSFIATGLYPHERRYVNVFGPLSIGLFLAGVFICEFFVIPKSIEALLWFNEWLGFEPDFRLNEWLSFAIMMPLVFGISFQTPLVMLFLERIGVLSVESFRGKRRVSWFVMLIFAAIITPSVDAIGVLFLWLPMGLLYELGIILCIMSPKRPTLDIDVPDADELIEV